MGLRPLIMVGSGPRRVGAIRTRRVKVLGVARFEVDGVAGRVTAGDHRERGLLE